MLTELQKRKLMKLFSMYDACNLGVLRISDFERLAQQLAEMRGWKPGTEAYEKLINQYLFRWNRMRAEIKQTLNVRNDGQVNLDEWLTYYDTVLNDQAHEEDLLALAEAVFNVVDVDQSGHLDQGEWTELFRAYNIPVIYVEETFARIDRDGDGALSKAEVLSMIREFYYSSDPDAAGNYMFGPI
jgi:Ca2+-binding EF-hand superfamily protein